MARDPLPRPIYAQIMSTYLLLRNNQESGPFSIEEIKGMSLKSYDLLWIVGKSAAWRYPGEISELKSFAPPIPEQTGNPFIKNKNAENLNAEALQKKKTEPANTKNRESSTSKPFPTHSVYVNLPAEKNPPSCHPPESCMTPKINPQQNLHLVIHLYIISSPPGQSG